MAASSLNASRLQTSFASAAYSPTRAAIFSSASTTLPGLAPPAPAPKPIATAAAVPVGYPEPREEGISPVAIAAGVVGAGLVGLLVYKLKFAKKKKAR